MSKVIYETRKNGESDTVDSAAKLLGSLSEDVVNVLRILGVTIEQLINLARYNPQFGAVIGILTTNILSHKIDWLHWQHQELICLDCNGITVSNNGTAAVQNGGIIGTILNGFLTFTTGGQVAQGIVSLSQFFASHQAPGPAGGPGQGTSGSHATAYVWVPGIIDQTANLIITGIITASFGLSAGGFIVGTILQDITNITKISGNTPPPQSLITPTPPNVEAGSQIKTNQTFTKGLGPEGT